ncbi:MAG: SRPBCC domain-containing protein [Caulobacteraceae bacterium]
MAAQHDTFVLQRTYPKPPEKVFAALSNPEKKQRWFGAPHGEGNRFDMDFRIGGAEHNVSLMGQETPFPGTVLSSLSIYQDIVPDQRIVLVQTMSLGDQRISSALITFEVEAAGDGATLTLTHQAAFYERADGPKMRQEGWVSLMARLTAELEAA